MELQTPLLIHTRNSPVKNPHIMMIVFLAGQYFVGDEFILTLSKFARYYIYKIRSPGGRLQILFLLTIR